MPESGSLCDELSALLLVPCSPILSEVRGWDRIPLRPCPPVTCVHGRAGLHYTADLGSIASIDLLHMHTRIATQERSHSRYILGTFWGFCSPPQAPKEIFVRGRISKI